MTCRAHEALPSERFGSSGGGGAGSNPAGGTSITAGQRVVGQEGGGARGRRGNVVGTGAPVNLLGDLVRERSAELKSGGLSITKQAQRGGWVHPNPLRYYLNRTEPFKQLIRKQGIDQLAAALDLPWPRIWEAAVLSTLPEHPTPLQRLLREAQARIGLDNAELAERGGVDVMWLSRILKGSHGQLRDDTIRKLAKAFDLPQKRISEAAAHSTTEYVLPANVASRMTPKKWDELLRIAEIMVST